jgi:hypothetical protein
MGVSLRLEFLLEDEIVIGMEGNHDVLIPLCALTGKWPVSSVYSLLRGGYTGMKTCLDGTSALLGAVVGSARGDKGVGSLDLADLTFWRCWTRCPKIVLLALGQYLATLEYVRLSKMSQFYALMTSNHGCFTKKPRQAW